MATPRRRNAVLRFLFGDPYDVLLPDESVVAVASAQNAFLEGLAGCLPAWGLFLVILPPYLVASEIARFTLGRPVMLGRLCIVTDRRVVLVAPFGERAADLSAIRAVEWRERERFQSGGVVTVDVIGPRKPLHVMNLKDPESLATAIDEQVRRTRQEPPGPGEEPL